jgi:hypothetical protein
VDAAGGLAVVTLEPRRSLPISTIAGGFILNEQIPLARVILHCADLVRTIRKEVNRLDREGYAAIAGRVETRAVSSHAGSLVNALIEVAARLAVNGDNQPFIEREKKS